MNFCRGRTTHERFSEGKNEDQSLLKSYKGSSMHSSHKSVVYSDMLVHDETDMQSFNYVPNQEISNSYVGVRGQKCGCKQI